jgi:hypothetical protein
MAQKKYRSTVRTAIDAAVGCLPTELSGLITDYVVELPHTFLPAAGSVDVVSDDGGWRTEITGIQTGLYKWNTLISAQTFAVGHLQWTVDFETELPDVNQVVWIGVGVTSWPTNHRVLDSVDLSFPAMASSKDRLLFPYERSKYIHTINVDDRFPTPTKYENRLPNDLDLTTFRYRFAFVADPADGTVRCRVLLADQAGRWRLLNDGPPITLLTASTAYQPTDAVADEGRFASLRPCVVIGGRQRAVFRSGQAADDFQAS